LFELYSYQSLIGLKLPGFPGALESAETRLTNIEQDLANADGP
jgi:hypothetical protein